MTQIPFSILYWYIAQLSMTMRYFNTSVRYSLIKHANKAKCLHYQELPRDGSCSLFIKTSKQAHAYDSLTVW